MIKILKDENSNIRERAAEVFGKIRESAVEPLIRALKDKNSYVRWGAALALGRIGDKRAVELLIKALKDGNSAVRKEAAEALGRIKAVEALIKALKVGYSDVRAKATWAREIGDRKAAEPLVHALKDEEKNNSEVNQKTIWASTSHSLSSCSTQRKLGFASIILSRWFRGMSENFIYHFSMIKNQIIHPLKEKEGEKYEKENHSSRLNCHSNNYISCNIYFYGRC